MFWYFLIGSALTAWTLLLLLSGERQSRLNEIEIKRHNDLVAAAAKEKRKDDIPVVG